MATTRLTKELKELQKQPVVGVNAWPESSLFEWRAELAGPEGSPYEGGVFRLSLEFHTNHPFSPPKVKFLTKIYHPNISKAGDICLDILKSNWSPALTVTKLLLSISSLLTDPNPDDPLVPAIAKQFNRNRKLFDKTARQWTLREATPVINLVETKTPSPVKPKPAPVVIILD